MPCNKRSESVNFNFRPAEVTLACMARIVEIFSEISPLDRQDRVSGGQSSQGESKEEHPPLVFRQKTI